MTTKDVTVDPSEFFSLGEIYSKKDLKCTHELAYRLPNDRCDCCGRHLSELKRFGKEGPIGGDYEGALLVCRVRVSIKLNLEPIPIHRKIFVKLRKD